MICERLYARLFTPKHPSTLPKSQWLSYTRLFSIVQPYAPAGASRHLAHLRPEHHAGAVPQDHARVEDLVEAKHLCTERRSARGAGWWRAAEPAGGVLFASLAPPSRPSLPRLDCGHAPFLGGAAVPSSWAS